MRSTLTFLILFISLNIQANESLGSFDDKKLCIAAIATNNGRAAKGIRFLDKQGDVISVAYTRDDGKIFGYSCKLDSNEIRWKDQSMGNWNKNIRVYYSILGDGEALNIKSVMFGDPLKKSYSLSDF